MAAVAVDAAEGVAVPLHRVVPSARKGRHLVGGAGNPHLCGKGAVLEGYADGPGGLALTVLQSKKNTATRCPSPSRSVFICLSAHSPRGMGPITPSTVGTGMRH